MTGRPPRIEVCHISNDDFEFCKMDFTAHRMGGGVFATLSIFVAGAAVVLIVSFAIRLIFFDFACITETQKKIIDLSGFDFEMIEVNCDTLAKDSAVNVFIAKTGDSKKTLIFKYDPMLEYSSGQAAALLPAIRFDSPTVVTIAIPIVGAIYSQQFEWETLSIRYEIGRVTSE